MIQVHNIIKKEKESNMGFWVHWLAEHAPKYIQ